MKLARIVNDTVVNIELWESLEAAREANPSGTFAAADGLAVGMIDQGAGTFDFPEKPLEQVKAEAGPAVFAFIDSVEARITAPYPAMEIQSWPLKMAEAKAVLAGEEPSADATPLLIAEAGDPETTKALAGKVIAKSKVFAEAAGLTARMRAEAMSAIELAQNPAEVQAILDAAEQEANTKLAALFPGIGAS